MVTFTIASLKQALLHIQNNSSTLTYYGIGPKDGLIVSDDLDENAAYHLRIAQVLEPQLITRLTAGYTALSLAGQELLHILSDSTYLQNLELMLRRDGYSEPADVQVFRLLRKRLDNDATVSLAEVMKMLMERALGDTMSNPLPLASAEHVLTDMALSETLPELTPETPITSDSVESKAEKLIRNTRKEIS